MSSPFQKNFSAKSPLNGNYYSGVDGIKYVSPKPGVIDIPQGTKKKEEEEVKPPEVTKVPKTREKLEPVVDLKPSEIKTSKADIVAEINPAKVVLKNRTEVKERLTFEQAWKLNKDGVKDKYKNYKSYIADRTGQKTVDPKGYEKDLLDKTGLTTTGRQEIDYQKIDDGDEFETGRRIYKNGVEINN